MALTSEKSVEKLRQRLGALDNERRLLMETLRNHPENITIFTRQTLEQMINSKYWFQKETTKGKVYAQLTAVEVDKPLTKVKNSTTVAAHRRPIVTAKLTWNQVSEENPATVSITSKIIISVFSEIEPQILNGFKRTELTDKSVMTAILDLKEKALLEQIRLIKEEKKKLK